MRESVMRELMLEYHEYLAWQDGSGALGSAVLAVGYGPIRTMSKVDARPGIGDSEGQTALDGIPR